MMSGLLSILPLLLLLFVCCFPPRFCSTVKPHVAVVGSGWGGWGAAKTLLQNGCRVTLLDSLPDPTGKLPYKTPTGKPFEAGTRGFWQDYPNINKLVKELNLNEDDIFTPCTNSSFYSPYGLEATAPVFSASSFPILPSPVGQILATFELFERLPLSDRASMFGLLYATIDFTRNEQSFEAYDKMAAYQLFQKYGLSKRLVDDFIRPTLLVGLFKPPEELSAAVTMELLYFYALAHQTSFDVRWIKGRSISETIIFPLAKHLQSKYGDDLTIVGGAKVTSLMLSDPKSGVKTAGSEENNASGMMKGGRGRTTSSASASLPQITGLSYTKKGSDMIELTDLDACVLALGAKGLKSVLAGSPAVASASPELTRAASLGSIDVIACRLWLDKKVVTRTPANVFSQFDELRGAGGTFFMLDQLQGTTKQGENMLWGEENNNESETDEKSGENNEEQKERGSVVACDFYNSGGLMQLSDVDIVALLMGRRPDGTNAPDTVTPSSRRNASPSPNDASPRSSPGIRAESAPMGSRVTTPTATPIINHGVQVRPLKGLLPQAVRDFENAHVVDYYIQRYPGAVNHFAPNSYKLRPPLQLADIGNCVCAGDWVRMGTKEHGAKGLCQERAFVSGIEAANVLARSGVLAKAAMVKSSLAHNDETSHNYHAIRHIQEFPVIPVRDDELQFVIARSLNKQLIDILQRKPPTSLFELFRNKK